MSSVKAGCPCPKAKWAPALQRITPAIRATEKTASPPPYPRFTAFPDETPQPDHRKPPHARLSKATVGRVLFSPHKGKYPRINPAPHNKPLHLPNRWPTRARSVYSHTRTPSLDGHCTRRPGFHAREEREIENEPDRHRARRGAASTAIAPRAHATDLPFSTGFEASQGYTSGTQLFTYADWQGNGQDEANWTVTNSTIGGLGAASGSQWVLVNSPTASQRSRTQWPVTPVTDFTTNPLITGSADVRLIAPASGTLNRTTSASIGMIDNDGYIIASLSLIIDCQNTFGFGANRMLLQFYSFGVSQRVYDLGINSDLTHYYNLSLTAD